MTNSRLHTLDIRLLRYFAVVAEENNIASVQASSTAERLEALGRQISTQVKQFKI